MNKRFGALKNNDNIFKTEVFKRRAIDDRGTRGTYAPPFKGDTRETRGGRGGGETRETNPHRRNQLAGTPDMFQENRKQANTVSKNFDLHTEVFPELHSKPVTQDTISRKTQLNFNKIFKKSESIDLNNSPESVVISRAVTNFDSAASQKSLKMTMSIIRHLDERELKANYMRWYNNWQLDRNNRIEDGETFYELDDLDELDDYSDSGSSINSDPDETEYWGSKGRSYDN
jgi:hypothetical protein